MTDPPVVRVTPRAGYPEHKIVDEFICPEGHVVQKPDERSRILINHIYSERSLVFCEDCDTHYSLYPSWTASEASDDLVERAREEGYID